MFPNNSVGRFFYLEWKSDFLSFLPIILILPFGASQEEGDQSILNNTSSIWRQFISLIFVFSFFRFNVPAPFIIPYVLWCKLSSSSVTVHGCLCPFYTQKAVRRSGPSSSGLYIYGHSSASSPEELLKGKKQRLATLFPESQVQSSACSEQALWCPLRVVTPSLCACAGGLAGIPLESWFQRMVYFELTTQQIIKWDCQIHYEKGCAEYNALSTCCGCWGYNWLSGLRGSENFRETITKEQPASGENNGGWTLFLTLMKGELSYYLKICDSKHPLPRWCTMSELLRRF